MSCYIGGCVRNCGNQLDFVFDNIYKIQKLFKECHVVIAYDNSHDNSLDVLNEIKQNISCEMTILVNENEMASKKTENIANARNSILDFIRKEENPYEFFIMIDMDDICSCDMDIDVLSRYLTDDRWDSLSFNRKDYYDIWALSIEPYLISCWHWDEYQMASLPQLSIMQKYITNILENMSPDELLPCHSAFNGFAIYRTVKYINSEYSANIYKSLSLIDDNLKVANICEMNKKTEKDNKVYTVLEEDCEHRYFHFLAKLQGARNMISPLKLFHHREENDAYYMGSRGILKSCDIRSNAPCSSINCLINYNISNYNQMFDGCTMYVCNYAIPAFAQSLHYIQHKFILVSGDSDCDVPTSLFKTFEEFEVFINNKNLIHWYAQNCVVDHPKITQMPIGLDYHTMRERNSPWGLRRRVLDQENDLIQLKNTAPPFWERKVKCYSNFHFFTTTKYGYDRKDAMDKIPIELVRYEKTKL